MFLRFFLTLRKEGFPASLHEYLAFLEGLNRGLVNADLEELYFLARTIFVKNEVWLDRFDKIFGAYFKGEEFKADWILSQVPPEWLVTELNQVLDPDELRELEESGGLEALRKRFEELLEIQKEKHQGGNRFIGTGGTSPFGNSGQNQEGVKMGQGAGGGGRNSVRLWNTGDFADLSDSVELNTRNIKMALRKLRLLTREGRPDEFDLNGTIRKTSDNGGLIDIAMRPERKNRVKVLLLMDVGGSMYDHVQACEQLFSAAKHEFKQMEYYYFHNCVYDKVWRHNEQRFREVTPTMELFAKYKKDWKLIVLGDAAMAPYELHAKIGSIHANYGETGIDWLRRLRSHFEYSVWLNPNPDYGWSYFATTVDIRREFNNRMFPMTIAGLEKSMKALRDQNIRHDEVWVRA
jgi:uncharacterized protein with von Willebrand factor type A (vWA) domain